VKNEEQILCERDWLVLLIEEGWERLSRGKMGGKEGGLIGFSVLGSYMTPYLGLTGFVQPDGGHPI
jgi:hypothetical protein